MKFFLTLVLLALLALIARPMWAAVGAYRAARVCDSHGGTVVTFTAEGRTATGCRDGAVFGK